MILNLKIQIILIIFNGLAINAIKNTTKDTTIMTTLNATKNHDLTLVCLIKNIKYKDEFLYSTFDIDELKQRKVYSNEINPNLMQHSDQLLWILKPVDWLKDVYYITNYYYNEHLCAHHTHLERFNYRRYVYLVKMNKESIWTNQKCMWQLRKLKNNKHNYTIWNVNYKEPLYAASFMLKTARTDRRNLFLWYKKPDSTQFNWNLECISHY